MFLKQNLCFISTIKDNKKIYKNLVNYKKLGMTNVYNDYKDKFKFLNIKFGENISFFSNFNAWKYFK